MASDADLWHFVCDESDDSWTWKRVAASGEVVAESAYSFRSFKVCVADAELEGFTGDPAAVRRLRSSDLGAHSVNWSAAPERRRRERTPGIRQKS